MRIAPNTRFSDVIRQLNILLELGTYQDQESFRMRQIKRECEKVRDVEPALGWGLLSCFYSVTGDIDEVERCYLASRRLEKNPVLLKNHHTYLMNFGYFSRAHDFFVAEAKPETGMFSQLAAQGFEAGSISTLVSYDEQARSLGVDIPEQLHQSAAQAAAILGRAQITDRQVVRQLDAVGMVLRKHRMFFDGGPQVESTDIDGVFSGVNFVFRVKRLEAEVFDLNVELALREEELGVQKHVAFDAMFLPS